MSIKQNFNRTGPIGKNPMIGWGQGYCTTPLTSARWPLFGRGFGGRGGGRGWRHRYWATGLPGWARRAGLCTISSEQELDLLKHKAKMLKSELDEVNARINQLEKSSRSNEQYNI